MSAGAFQPFVRVSGRAAPLLRSDVDTDQIIPKQFLKRIERYGYGPMLFWDWRTRPDGAPDPDFVLNRPEHAGAVFLLAGRNFGCGSSREHAAWALRDAGFRGVLAPSFADIFRSNAFQNGILPVVLPEETIAALARRVEADPTLPVTVDLESCTVSAGDEELASFQVDPFRRRSLLEGLDDIGLTLEHEEAIAAFERGVDERGW
jgi:3-isopropylmalate/(R)-2-methylmalate dehydratase small subunit